MAIRRNGDETPEQQANYIFVVEASRQPGSPHPSARLPQSGVDMEQTVVVNLHHPDLSGAHRKR